MVLHSDFSENLKGLDLCFFEKKKKKSHLVQSLLIHGTAESIQKLGQGWGCRTERGCSPGAQSRVKNLPECQSKNCSTGLGILNLFWWISACKK